MNTQRGRAVIVPKARSRRASSKFFICVNLLDLAGYEEFPNAEIFGGFQAGVVDFSHPSAD
jgi:hypothetical protein